MIRSEEKLTLEGMYLTEKAHVEAICRTYEGTYLSESELKDKGLKDSWAEDFMGAWDMGYKAALTHMQEMLIRAK